MEVERWRMESQKKIKLSQFNDNQPYESIPSASKQASKPAPAG